MAKLSLALQNTNICQKPKQLPKLGKQLIEQKLVILPIEVNEVKGRAKSRMAFTLTN